MQKVESKTSQNLRVSSNFEEDMEDITRILNDMNSTLSFKSTSGDLKNEQNYSEDFQNFYHSVQTNYLPPIHSFKDQDMGKCSNIPYYSFLERRKNPLNYGTLPDLSASKPLKNLPNDMWSTQSIQKVREKVLDRLLRSPRKDIGPNNSKNVFKNRTMALGNETRSYNTGWPWQPSGYGHQFFAGVSLVRALMPLKTSHVKRADARKSIVAQCSSIGVAWCGSLEVGTLRYLPRHLEIQT
ncbi:hypothetical protein TNCV_509621 [Trichonephila clavipes]|nr:hypothetical protein TNCV_509621 [Trichonephila clavipes]